MTKYSKNKISNVILFCDYKNARLERPTFKNGFIIFAERDTEKILHLIIQAWNLHHIFITSHAFKNDSWPLQIRTFSRWPPKTKMADISLGNVCGKLVISQFLVIVEHQIWYQIKATALPVSIKFKYAN